MSPAEMDAIDLDELDAERILTMEPEGGGPRVMAPWALNLQRMIAENDQRRLEAERQREIGRPIELGPVTDG